MLRINALFFAPFLFVSSLFAETGEVINFDIPETTLDKALNKLGQQANLPVLFPFDQVQSIKAPRILGSFTIEKALDCMTFGTGLSTSVTKAGAIIVVFSENNNNPAARDSDLVADTYCHSVEDNPVKSTDSLYEAKERLLEEVIVTSRRYSESIIDAPFSVTSVSGQRLQNLIESEITAVDKLSPNVNFATTGAVSGSTSTAVIYIRGIGQNDYVPVTDPNVGVFVDDVYYGRSVGAVLNLADVRKIEILRGPQGTLLGRNTVGGAISMATHDPSGDTSGSMRTVFGNQGRRELSFAQNAVLGEQLNARVSLVRRQLDGTVSRVNVPGPNLGNENNYSGRLKFDWSPSKNVRVVLAGDYNRDREQSAAEVNANFSDSAELPAAWNGFSATRPLASTASGCVQGRTDVGTDCYNNRFRQGPFTTAEDSISRNNVDSWGVSASLDLGTNDERWQSRVIMARRELKAFLARQADGSPLDIFENRESYLSNQSSLDLRLGAQFEKLHFSGGFFYFNEQSDNQGDFSGVFNGTLYPVHYGGITDNENMAVYGQVDLDLGDRFHLSMGLRHTDETKRATPNAFRFVGCDIDLAPLSPTDCAQSNEGHLVPRIEQENSFKKITWSSALSYELDNNTRVYVNASTGFKSGGFEWRVIDDSFRELALTQAANRGLSEAEAQEFVDINGALPQFNPENVLTYELGIKGLLGDGRARYSLSLFDSRYRDQIVATNLLGLATQQTNAAESSFRGAEIELSCVPSTSWEINFSGGYINAKYKKLTGNALRAGLSLDDRPIYAPRVNASLAINYSQPLYSGSLVSQLRVRHKSSQEFEPVNTRFARDEGFTELDLGFQYKPQKGSWSFSAGFRNLTDQRYKVSGDANNTIGYENVIYARPRNAYMSFSYQWK